jgi:hypothetical protein
MTLIKWLEMDAAQPALLRQDMNAQMMVTQVLLIFVKKSAEMGLTMQHMLVMMETQMMEMDATQHAT